MMLTHLLLAFLPLPTPSIQDIPEPAIPSDVEGFRHAQGKLAVGRVYHYRKSNVDGTRSSHVDLYVASADRIESFKYSEGNSQGTLVTADMDWRTFSVRRFETYKLHREGAPTKVAQLDSRDGTLHGQVGGGTFSLPVEHFPWHTYDFDLASLNISLRYLTDPEGVVLLGMIDPVRGQLSIKGFVELRYLSDEERAGVACRRYSIDGPGLEDRGGDIWVRLGDDPVIVDYEIDLPDEPGMKSGKLQLMRTGQFTREEWEQHKVQALR